MAMGAYKTQCEVSQMLISALPPTPFPRVSEDQHQNALQQVRWQPKIGLSVRRTSVAFHLPKMAYANTDGSELSDAASESLTNHSGMPLIQSIARKSDHMQFGSKTMCWNPPMICFASRLAGFRYKLFTSGIDECVFRYCGLHFTIRYTMCTRPRHTNHQRGKITWP